MRQPVEIYRKEMQFFWEVEGERLADWTFSEIREKLLKNEIPWKSLPSREKNKASFLLSDAKLQLPTGKEKRVERSFDLVFEDDKVGERSPTYRLFLVQVHFSDPLKGKKYFYKILVRKLVEEKV